MHIHAAAVWMSGSALNADSKSKYLSPEGERPSAYQIIPGPPVRSHSAEHPSHPEIRHCGKWYAIISMTSNGESARVHNMHVLQSEVVELLGDRNYGYDSRNMTKWHCTVDSWWGMLDKRWIYLIFMMMIFA